MVVRLGAFSITVNTMINIALYQPAIPQNTGNIARLCACTGAVLHLIEPLGFQLTDKYVKRAGMDYLEQAVIQRHPSFEAFLQTPPGNRLLPVSKFGNLCYADWSFHQGDTLLFGSESKGLPKEWQNKQESVLYIPMKEGARALNLSSSVAIVAYEALRQLGFGGI